ncbi:MAG: XdhC/CoxI family protein [Thermodesulfobacteriota bacterium]|nr:XdhC/CoxI family protein [Thermodesulfobacteriota bacterium]
MENIYLKINRCLQEGQRTVLARIIRQSGSAPRTIGAQCLITEEGDLMGTVGGGRLEFEVLDQAKVTFREGRSTLLPFRMTGNEVAESEMLCGGSVDVYLEPIFPENEVARKIFNHLATIVGHGHTGVLITRISAGIDPTDTACRMLIGKSGHITGELADMPPDQNQRLSHLIKTRQVRLFESGDGTTLFIEPIQPDDVLYLFGAGHISRPVAILAEMVGFTVVVIDDRDEFANRKRFPKAKKIIVTPFVTAFDKIHINSSSYVVIVTRGHVHDRDILRQALNHPGGYIGMIGSRRKRKIIYQSLMDNGISADQLDQVHSPIGLSIGAQTPEEIAVSIVAELIQVRASLDNPDDNEIVKTNVDG